MLREIFTFLGFQFDEGGFKRAVQATDEVKKKAQDATDGFDGLAKAARVFTSILAAGVITKFATGIADQAFEVGQLSEQLGINAHDLQAWELGAKEVGISNEQLTLGFRRLSSALAGGKGEAGTQAKLFAELKIQTRDATGHVKTLDAILPEIAEHFKSMAEGPTKAALAQELFGRSGSKLIPILNQGAAGIAKLRTEFDKLGGGFSDEAIKQAEEFRVQTARLDQVWISFKNTIALSFLPYLTKTLDLLVETGAEFKKWADDTTLVSNGVEILAGVLAFQLAGALAPYLGTGLKFAAIYLAVDDLLAFLDGKDSVIGALLNRAFGDGSATAVRAWVNDAKDSFGGWLEAFKTVLPDISAAFSVQFAKVGASWDSMILGFENTWNEFVGTVTGFSGLQFKAETIAKRQGMVQQDAANVAAAQQHKDQTAQAVANFASAITPLSGAGAAAPTGPLRAPQITQNFVEVKPNISITVPPGTSQEHAARLVREAAAGVTSTERRAAGQSLQQKAGQ